MSKNKVDSSAMLENIDLIPTQIATTLTQQTGKKISCIKVNEYLAKLGLQQKLKTRGGKSQWQLTEQGKKYGRVYQVESSYSNWSGNQVKWGEEVIELLKQNLLKLTA
ncbi:MAG: hypothetical protein MUE44_36570 [Oscillatoriaceae cyanobacterium Prado104]|nr:hypothetical protein [Oscillatoriaceae cyanobacterium Prado104]